MRDTFPKRTQGLIDKNLDHLIVNDLPHEEYEAEEEEE